MEIEGQLNVTERRLITEAIVGAAKKPLVAIEVGTWLGGGNNPREQIEEFELLDPLIPVGGQLMSHDAKMRKGRWLVPFITRLDNWESQLHDVSENGLFHAKKIAGKPSPQSLWAAKRNLFRQACHPVEIAASYLPSSVCAFALRLLPGKFSRHLSDGKN
jgi:hypothetical protein